MSGLIGSKRKECDLLSESAMDSKRRRDKNHTFRPHPVAELPLSPDKISRHSISAFRNDEYTVGWISALPIEMAAAKGMLDEEHGDPQDLPQKPDQNTYLLGRIGTLRVVIACLPKHEIGNFSAASVASHMLHTFPNIRVGLLVGIGAGIPDYEGDTIRDIRLGDVVISSDKENGGVVLYDFGQKLADGSFRTSCALDRPPRSLRTAISRLETEHLTRENNICQYIEDMVQKYPFMRKKGYCYPGASADQLFSVNSLHVGTKTCSACDAAGLVDRRFNRPDSVPVIHYGVIASGSAVVKHAWTRADVGKKHGAICLEMEAAGLMNHFPCVVIRGISDYGDSHKNDQWQPYAAATAAACAKELLGYVQLRSLEVERTAKDILENALAEIRADVSDIKSRTHTTQQNAILNWLTIVDYGAEQSNIIHRRQPGTGSRLLLSAEFKSWMQKESQTLFCLGVPGAGKTVATAIVIDHILSQWGSDSNVGIAFVYCNFRRQHEQRDVDIIASLLKQLIRQQSSIPESVMSLYKQHSSRDTYPSVEELCITLQSVAADFSRTFIFIDALDECRTQDGVLRRLLRKLFDILASTETSLFATSRFVPEIEKEFKGRSVQLEIRACDDDLRQYIKGNVSNLPAFVSGRADLKLEINAAIIEAVDGIFLLAYLYLRSLAGKPSPKAIRHALQNLPRGSEAYDYAYQETMRRVEGQVPDSASLGKRVLAWITYAKRSLTVTELQHALAVEEGGARLDEQNLPDLEEMVSSCAGLVILSEASDEIRLVHYTAQEYLARTGKYWFPNAEDDMAITCLRYLSFDAFSRGCCKTDGAFCRRIQLHPLFDYAARNWGYHAQFVLPKSHNTVLAFLQNQKLLSSSIQGSIASDNFSWRWYTQYETRGATGMHIAAYFGLHQVAADLLRKGLYPDKQDSLGQTPLCWAATEGFEKVVELLLKRNDVATNSRDSHGRTPLSRAASNGYEKVVKLLLQRNDIAINSRDNSYRTPLSWAAEKGCDKVVELLLKRKDIMVNLRDDIGMAPLLWAARDGHAKVVELLLERNDVKADLRDKIGRTPLLWAAKKNHEKVVELLLTRGDVETNSRDTNGWTPLLWAVREGHEKVVELLLKRDDVTVNSHDTLGWTPLIWAEKKGHHKVATLLRNYNPSRSIELGGYGGVFGSLFPVGMPSMMDMLHRMPWLTIRQMTR